MKIAQALPRFKYVCMIISLAIVVPLSSYLLWTYDNTSAGISRTTNLAVKPGAMPTVMRHVIDIENECQTGTRDCDRDHCWAFERLSPELSPRLQNSAYSVGWDNVTGAFKILPTVLACVEQLCMADDKSDNHTSHTECKHDMDYFQTCMGIAVTNMIGVAKQVPLEECVLMPTRVTAHDVRTNNIDICRTPTDVSAGSAVETLLADIVSLANKADVSQCVWPVYDPVTQTIDQGLNCSKTVVQEHMDSAACTAECSNNTNTMACFDCRVKSLMDYAGPIGDVSFADWQSTLCNGGATGAFAKSDGYGVSSSSYDRKIGTHSKNYASVVHGEPVTDLRELLESANVDCRMSSSDVRTGLIIAVVLSVVLVFSVYMDMVKTTSSVTVGESARLNINEVTIYIATLIMYWAVAATFWVMCVKNVWQTSTGNDSGFWHEDNNHGFVTLIIYYLGVVNFVVAAMWTLRSIAAGALC